MPGAFVAIERDGKFLLIKRAEHETAPELWEFPGGKVEPGESIEQAAIREVNEETGFVIHSVKPVARYQRLMHSGDAIVDVHIFHAQNPSGRVTLADCHSDFKWVEKKDLTKSIGKRLPSSDVIEFVKAQKRGD